MAIFYTDTASIELLTVTNLTATTSSISYITQSQLNVENNLITVNTNSPQVRFGGFAVIDSGSSDLSGSLLFDSQNNQWIYVHQSAPGADITSSVLIMGPQTFNNVGGETTIITNRLTKGSSGDLGEHITSSNITDTGTLVSINSNTEVTGSLIVTAGLTGSLLGTASWAESASQAISSSYALSASYAPGGGGVTINNNTDNYILTATGTANTINGESNLTFDGTKLTVTGHISASAGITGSLLGTASTASYYASNGNILVFSGSGAGTYTPTAGMKFVKVIVTGGGGAGGLCSNTDTATGGGAAGGTAIRKYSAAEIGASQPYFVGAGGAGTTSPGGTGTASSFGGVGSATAISGSGGGGTTQLASATTLLTAPGSNSPGTGTGGEVNITGGGGGFGIRLNTTDGAGGPGGASFWGGGAAANGTDAAGNAATAFGAGGSGAHAPGATDRNGGAGAGGIVYIEEYF